MEENSDSKTGQLGLALAMGEALYLFLDSLATPVIPASESLQAQCVQASNRDEAFEVRGVVLVAP